MPFELTQEQRTILQHDPCRHARILAGPGTGKSTTLVALVHKLRGEDESLRMKVLTFTRATTAELAHKIDAESVETERPSTIHSFAISVLLQNPGAGGFPEPLRIVDTWEMKNIVEPTLAKRAGVQVRPLRKLVIEMASNWESLTINVEPEISGRARTGFHAAWPEHRQVLGYTLLQELPYALLRALNDHDCLEGIDYDLLLVDEYQDLNACDLDVVRLLSQKGSCAIIATGDDDQSIYSWRKAAPEGIRRFLDDYEGAQDYTLSVTLRCGRSIIEWANYVIQADPGRPRGRVVISCRENAPQGQVALLRFRGERSEATGVAQIVKGLIDREGLKPADILVLMRTDHNITFSLPLRRAIGELGVSCSDPNEVLELLNDPHNRRLLEVFRLLVDRNDSLAWASVLKLADGIGGKFFDYIYERAKARRTSFAAELLAAFRVDFPDAPRDPASRAKNLITNVIAWLDSRAIPDDKPQGGWGTWMIENSGSSQAPSSTEGLRQLLHAIDDLSQTNEKLPRFLALIEPRGKDLSLARSEGVRLMTMCGSKGLTVRVVIIVGVEEGLVPRPGEDLGEERRILYVAMTRATEYVFCTWAGRRRGPTARAGHPSMQDRRHSRFLDRGPVRSQDGMAFVNQRFGRR